MPDFLLEDDYDGFVCGLDEVGRGPLAGPVVAGCVYIPLEKRSLPFIAEIKDSKKLSEKKRDYLALEISRHFIWGVAECSPAEIDELNILRASLKAMERAFAAMAHPVGYALVDGNRLPANLPCPAKAVVKGDSLSVSIAAASIIAKVRRDKIMRELAAQHPHYGWERNAAYPTAEHLEALSRHGVTAHHRKTFGPVRDYLGKAAITSAG